MNTREDLDLTVLEDILNAPHCENKHKVPGNEECSHTPVARSYGCNFDNKVCLKATLNLQGRMHRGVECAGCGKPSAQCWRIVPL